MSLNLNPEDILYLLYFIGSTIRTDLSAFNVGILQSESEFAVLSRAYCCKLNALKSSLIFLPWLSTRPLLKIQNKRRFTYFYRMVKVSRFRVVSIKITNSLHFKLTLFYLLGKRITVKGLCLLLASIFVFQYNDILTV